MALTQTALELLLARLHPDRQRAAEAYEMIRKKLIKYFEWQGCSQAEADADETIDRVAKKIDQGEQINDVMKYAYGVARLIVFEGIKANERQANLIRQLSYIPSSDATAESEEDQAKRRCMEMCLRGVPRANLEFITRYCQSENKTQNKKNLAAELGIKLNALRIRAHRIRMELKKCYADCLRRAQDHEII
jgi:DNA-directed RNA polymerase specialized sigma24 family protein